jgi:23S rRNA pseudouridine2605 synthase
MRLAKYLAHSGVASRRASESLITGGRVRVDDEVVRDPARDVDSANLVSVDGQPVQPESTEVWLVNKPPGVTSTASEPGRRQAVVELVDTDARLYPVGRLDVDSTGLILLTNDGELANRLTHPRYGVPKTYRVRLKRQPREQDLRRLRKGVALEDGPTAGAEVRSTDEREIEIVLREGRKRQVRRMVEAVGNRVEALARIRFGSLELANLPQGRARRLSPAEVERLWKDSGDERRGER